MKKSAPAPAYPELDAIGHRDGYPFAVGAMQQHLRTVYDSITILARSTAPAKEMRLQLERLAADMRGNVAWLNDQILEIQERSEAHKK